MGQESPKRKASGFIYGVRAVNADYSQRENSVPNEYSGRIYFGPCKRRMRPKMQPGDFIFGISPSGFQPRRIVFAARIAERMNFADAYDRYPKLRGRNGQIHMQPSKRGGIGFPDAVYEHIPGAMHEGDWRDDLRTEQMDAFFVCDQADGAIGRWLGFDGPVLMSDMVFFLRSCGVRGVRELGLNVSATATSPIRHGRLYTGLHLETDRPEVLLAAIRSGTFTPSGSSETLAVSKSPTGPRKAKRSRNSKSKIASETQRRL
jgi:hypothetical protein